MNQQIDTASANISDPLDSSPSATRNTQHATRNTPSDPRPQDDLALLLLYATRLLLWIAPLEFVLGRAISRASRQMPAGETMAEVFSAISTVGNFLVMPAFILVLLVLTLAAGLALNRPTVPAGPAAPGWPRPLVAGVLLFEVFSVGMLLPDTPPLLLLLYNFASAIVILGILGLGIAQSGARPALRVTLTLFALAYAGYYVYALGSTLVQGFGAPVSGVAVAANNLGEAAAMAAGISLFALAGLWPRPAGAPRPRLGWIIGAVMAFVLIAVASLFEEWIQGVATQFSVGFTLFLPVPVTALALAAWVYAVLSLNSRQAHAQSALPWAWEAGAALILLPTAGYALQLNYQHLLLAVTFLLLTGLLRPVSAQPAPAPAETRNTQHATRITQPETKQP